MSPIIIKSISLPVVSFSLANEPYMKAQSTCPDTEDNAELIEPTIPEVFFIIPDNSKKIGHQDSPGNGVDFRSLSFVEFRQPAFDPARA